MKIMEKQIVKIPRGAKIGPNQEPIYGYLEVEAYCKGGLAVHKAADKGSRWKWSVTHINTGMKIDAIGDNTKRDTVARMELALALDFDWTMSEADTMKALRENRWVTDAIRKIGERN
jgi:hypothetical protein